MKTQSTKQWVLVGPEGQVFGSFENADAAWRHGLGWPDAQEIWERKQAGWYAAEATLTWESPK